MRLIDACNSFVSPEAIRKAVKDLPRHAVARMGIEQQMRWEGMGIAVSSTVQTTISADYMPLRPSTIAGHALIVDLDMRPDVIRFEVDGEVLSRIVHLRVPEIV